MKYSPIFRPCGAFERRKKYFLPMYNAYGVMNCHFVAYFERLLPIIHHCLTLDQRWLVAK